MPFESESWLPAVGYEGLYEVSDLGRVRSLPRVRRNGNPLSGRILRPGPQRRGYLTVALTGRDGVVRSRRVHQLVLAAFVGMRPEGMAVLHRNDVPGDNRLVNLYYGSRLENFVDARCNGRQGMDRAAACSCGHVFCDEPIYRDPNNGLRACAGCRSSWMDRHLVYG